MANNNTVYRDNGSNSNNKHTRYVKQILTIVLCVEHTRSHRFNTFASVNIFSWSFGFVHKTLCGRKCHNTIKVTSVHMRFTSDTYDSMVYDTLSIWLQNGCLLYWLATIFSVKFTFFFIFTIENIFAFNHLDILDI